MWNIPDEDEYWERRREEFENPPRRRSQWDDEEPPPLREDYLFLDEEQEELESKYGCPMVELDEDELLEIVAKKVLFSCVECPKLGMQEFRIIIFTFADWKIILRTTLDLFFW